MSFLRPVGSAGDSNLMSDDVQPNALSNSQGVEKIFKERVESLPRPESPEFRRRIFTQGSVQPQAESSFFASAAAGFATPFSIPKEWTFSPGVTPSNFGKNFRS